MILRSFVFVTSILFSLAFLPGCRSESSDPLSSSSVSDTSSAEKTSRPVSKKTSSFADSGAAWPFARGNARGTGFLPQRFAPPLKIDWEFELEDDAFTNSPVIAGSTVFVASTEGELIALSLDKGKEQWRYSAKNVFLASPSFRNGRIYIGDRKGWVHCVNAANGQAIWGFPSNQIIDKAVNFDGDRVLFTNEDGLLYCLDAKNGKEIWRYQSKAEDKNEQPLECFPTVVGRFVLLGGCNGYLIVIDLDTGKEVRSIELDDSTGSAAANDGKLAFLGTVGKTVWAIDYTTGRVAWEYHADKHAAEYRSSAAVTPTRIFVGSRDRRLHAINRVTGKAVWVFPTQGWIDGSPTVLDDVVYFGSDDGRFYAVDAKTGKELWNIELGGTVLGSPAFANDRLVVATDDGRVICFVRSKD